MLSSPENKYYIKREQIMLCITSNVLRQDILKTKHNWEKNWNVHGEEMSSARDFQIKQLIKTSEVKLKPQQDN